MTAGHTELTEPQRRLLLTTLTRHGLPTAAEPSPRSSSEIREAQFATELSARELEVLVLVAEGMTDAQIGRELLLSTETIKSHVKHLLAKLGAQNRTHAVAIGFRAAILELV